MKTRLLLTLFAMAACGCLAAADIVVMRDGRVYEGTVTRNEGLVRIATPTGVVEVNESDTVRISVPKPAASEPASQSRPAPATVASKPAETPVELPDAPISVTEMDRPEAYVFMLARELALKPDADLQQQLGQYKSLTKDSKRKIGADWISPDDFIRGRSNFRRFLAEADAALRKPDPKKPKDKLIPLKACQTRLREAAISWPDPILRKFLLAVEHYQEGQYRFAQTAFADLTENTPWIAGFQQGLAMTLLAEKQALDALEPAMEAVKLEPDSMDAYQLLAKAVKDTPGADLNDPKYLAARKLLDTYEKPANADLPSTQTNWLMPRGPWVGRDNTLPEPPMDRLTFMQCVGVPVGKHTLLTDQAIESAAVVFVQLDAHTVVPAKVRKLTSSGSTPLPPLSLVMVQGVDFTPAVDRLVKPTTKTAVTCMSVNWLLQMGVRTRKNEGTITSIDADGTMKLSLTVSPGEAAAPVFDANGKLVAMIAGKTDALADGGGPDKVFTLSQIASLLDRAGGNMSTDYSSTYSRVKHAATTQKADAATYMIVGVGTEKFTK